MKENIPPMLIGDDPLHGQTFEHPAFGQISASRVTGGASLYGSDFEHHAYIEIRIMRSQLKRDLSQDWFFGREQLVSVKLSEAQWATFVSSLDIGSGVPCTLDNVAGKSQPAIPLKTEREVASREVIERAMGMGGKVTQTIAAINGALGSRLPKKHREEILSHLKSLEQDLKHNVSFYVDSFDKHMEDTVEKAKMEVGAYVQNTLQRAGLEALAGKGPISLLPEPKITSSEGDN